MVRTRTSPSSSAERASSCGISTTQGAHHVAHRLIRTGPSCAARSRGLLPPASSNCIAGNGVPAKRRSTSPAAAFGAFGPLAPVALARRRPYRIPPAAGATGRE